MKHPKFLPLIAACVLLLGAGCFRKTVQPTIFPEPPERLSENMAGDFTVNTVTLNKHFVLNEYGACDINISYPQLKTEEWSETASIEFEQEVAHFVANALGATTDVNDAAELDGLANAYLDDCKTEITREYTELTTAGDELYTNLKRNLDIVFLVAMNEASQLVVGLDEYSYTGGAHPNQHQKFLNLDRNLNRLMVISDVIAPEQLQAFEKFEKTRLLTENRDNLYPEVSNEYEAFVEDKTVLSVEEQVTKFGSRTNFYLTPTALITFYNAYEIAPYAAGPIIVEIPKTDLTTFLLQK